MRKKTNKPPAAPPPSQTMEEVLAALARELEKPLPASPLLDMLDEERGPPVPMPAVPEPHVPEPPRGAGLGLAEKQMIGHMWHRLADQFPEDEDRS